MLMINQTETAVCAVMIRACAQLPTVDRRMNRLSRIRVLSSSSKKTSHQIIYLRAFSICLTVLFFYRTVNRCHVKLHSMAPLSGSSCPSKSFMCSVYHNIPCCNRKSLDPKVQHIQSHSIVKQTTSSGSIEKYSIQFFLTAHFCCGHTDFLIASERENERAIVYFACGALYIFFFIFYHCWSPTIFPAF